MTSQDVEQEILFLELVESSLFFNLGRVQFLILVLSYSFLELAGASNSLIRSRALLDQDKDSLNGPKPIAP